MNTKLSLMDDLHERGLVFGQTSPDLSEWLESGSRTVYIGFDPSASSLHIGSLLQLATLRRFLKRGHKVICLAGGATGLIGDPSGKQNERNLQSESEIQRNLQGIKSNFETTLSAFGKDRYLVLNNYDWFANMNILSFLRDVGKHFSVNAMLLKDSVKSRLTEREQGISFTEFSYMLIQAYDFYYLYTNHGCSLQIGGSDQWGNITAGTDLIRRKSKSDESEKIKAFGLTMPLVTKSDGSKFGKSEGGNIWLNPEMTSPYDFYQFWLQTSDEMVGKLLAYYTDLSKEERETLLNSHKAAPEQRAAQHALAREMTEWVHGAKATEKSATAGSVLFSGQPFSDISPDLLKAALQQSLRCEVSESSLNKGISLVDALVMTEVHPSKGLARKEIQAGAVEVNGRKTPDPAYVLSEKDVLPSVGIILKKGKKTFAWLQIVN